MGTDLAGKIDHTILRADATQADIERLCEEAATHGFKAVCVNRAWIETAWRMLRGSNVLTCSVVGFPLGATSTSVKVFEASEAVGAGAAEIDMVLPVGALKAGRLDVVREDVAAVVRACRGCTVKVIIEACMLSDPEKVAACRAIAEAGAHFVKTSTGFGSGGATREDVELLRRTAGSSLKVKASGGIKTAAQALAMIRAGADRIGTSSGVSIMAEPAT